MKNLTTAPDWLTATPIAHRALHDVGKGRAENSMSAFKAAVDAGYAIECDVQLSATGELVVFHDRTLKRMTGGPGNVIDFTPEQLAQFRLGQTQDGIHTLKSHLDLVAGKVTVVIEAKGFPGHEEDIVRGFAAAAKDYDGPLAIMSFAHENCALFKTLVPDIPRGLTAEGDGSTDDLHRKAMVDYDLNFVSYSVKQLPNAFVKECRNARLPVITWTVLNDEHVATTQKFADQMTFEGFLPEVDSPR